MSGVCSRTSDRDPLEFTKFPVLFPDRREFAPWRPVRSALHPQPRSLVSVGHVWVAELCEYITNECCDGADVACRAAAFLGPTHLAHQGNPNAAPVGPAN